MRLRFPSVAAVILFAASALPAQQVALHETFEFTTTGLFPPAGWTDVNRNGNLASPGWEDPAVVPVNCSFLGLTDIAGHDDHGWGTGTHDNALLSPSLDLSGYGSARLVFDSAICNAWAQASAGLGEDGKSSIEVSTDGGLTWNQIWTDTHVANAEHPGTTVNLDPYAGLSQVQLAFLYHGTFAHQWSIDNVRVEEGSGAFFLQRIGACGQMTSFVKASNMTPFAAVGFAFSPTAGGQVYPAGSCGPVVSGLGSAVPMILGIVDADRWGGAEMAGVNGIPAPACGGFVQAIDLATCTMTNVVQL